MTRRARPRLPVARKIYLVYVLVPAYPPARPPPPPPPPTSSSGRGLSWSWRWPLSSPADSARPHSRRRRRCRRWLVSCDVVYPSDARVRLYRAQCAVCNVVIVPVITPSLSSVRCAVGFASNLRPVNDDDDASPPSSSGKCPLAPPNRVIDDHRFGRVQRCRNR